MKQLEVIRARAGIPPEFNQRASKALFEQQKRSTGSNVSKKAQRAEERRAKDQQFVEGWINRQSELRLSPKDRSELALKRGSDSDVEFLFDNIGDLEGFGYQVDVYTFPAKDQAEPEKTELAPLESKIA